MSALLSRLSAIVPALSGLLIAATIFVSTLLIKPGDAAAQYSSSVAWIQPTPTDNIYAGDDVVFRFSVALDPFQPSKIGNVEVRQGATVLCTALPSLGGLGAANSCTASGLAVGSHTVTAHYLGNLPLNTPSVSPPLTFTIQQFRPQTITFTAPAAQTFTLGGTVALTATGGASGNPVTFASTTTSVCTVSGSTATIVTAGTCSITASQAGNASYSAASDVPGSFTINRASQTLSFTAPADQGYTPGGSAALSAMATSGLAPVFTSATPAVCSVTGNQANILTAGFCQINADQPGDTNYLPASRVSAGFTINPASQATLTASASPTTIAFNGTSTLSTTGGSGTGAVSYAVTAGGSFCSVAGTTLTGTGVGTCTVTATKAADANYTQATDTVDVTVGPAPQTALTASAAPTSILFNGTSTLSTSGGSGTGAVSFAVTAGGSFCSVTGNTLTGTGAGTCTVTATKAADANYTQATDTVDVTVGQAAQAALSASASPTSIPFNGTSTLSTTGGSGTGAVSYAVTAGATFCSVAGNTLTGTGVGTCTVTATKAADANYTATTATTNVSVGPSCTGPLVPNGIGDLTFSPNTQGFGVAAQYQNCLGGNVGPIGTAVTYSSAVTTPASNTSTASGANTYYGAGMTLNAGLPPGSYSVTATFVPDAGGRYVANNSPVTINFNVVPAAQANFTATASPTTINFGNTTTLGSTGGSGTGAVTYAVTAGGSFCSLNGTTLTGTGVGTCTVTATKAADTNYTQISDTIDITVGPGTQATLNVLATPPGINVSETSNLAASGGSGTGAVSYAITNGGAFCSLNGTTVTGTGVGSCTITATKAADASFAATTATTTVTVNQVLTAVSLAASTTTPDMGAPVSLTATITPAPTSGTVSFVSGSTTLCSNVAVSGGTSVCQTQFSTAGAQSIVANFSGGGSFAQGSSSALTLTIGDTVTKTTRAVGRFVNERSRSLLSTMFSGSRQVGRLVEAGRQGSVGTGFNSQASTPAMGLGRGTDNGIAARSRLGDASGQALTAQRRVGLRGTHAGVLRNGRLPVDLNGSTDGVRRVEFSTSLRTIMKYAAQAEANRLVAAGYDGNTLPSSQSAYMPIDLWVEGKYTDFETDTGTSQVDGHFGLLTLGLDYVINPRLLLGAYVQYDTTEQSSKESQIDGKGWMGGLYGTVRLSENLFWQGRAAYGTSDNEIKPTLSYTDEFETERWLVSSSLVGRFTRGAWTITPSASITYFEDNAEAYRDTFGNLIPEVSSHLGQVKAGPEFSYQFAYGRDVMIEPRFGAHVVWDFASETTVAGLESVDGEGIGTGVRGRLELGARAARSDGMSLDLSGSYDGVGSDEYRAVTGRAVVRMPLN